MPDCIKRLWKFFKGAENLMFLFFVIISTAAMGTMTEITPCFD